MQRLLVPKFYLSIAIIWTGIVTYFCLVNSNSIPRAVKGLDKIAHFSFHFGMVFLWFLYFNAEKSNLKLRLKLRNAFLLSFFYGVFIELCQSQFTTTRSADIRDVLANSVGGIVAVLFMFVCFKYSILSRSLFRK